MMKLTLSGFALGLVLPLTALASTNDSYLLRADSMRMEAGRSIATGRAELRTNSGGTRITADTITHDRQSGVFHFAGAVTIHAGGTVIETKEATLKLDGQRVFMLSGGKISPAGGEPLEIQTGASRAEHVRLFGEPYRKIDTKLVPPAR